MKLKYISTIEFGKASRGWKCTIHFRVQTRRQFTMECQAVCAGSMGVSMFSCVRSFFYAYREMKRYSKELRNIEGQFSLED